MKNITLSADERLIEAARQRARAERTTLNAEFRRWLEHYSMREDKVREYESLMQELRRRVKTGGQTFNRDEMNER
jgi:ribosome recycling factor